MTTTIPEMTKVLEQPIDDEHLYRMEAAAGKSHLDESWIYIRRLIVEIGTEEEKELWIKSIFNSIRPSNEDSIRSWLLEQKALAEKRVSTVQDTGVSKYVQKHARKSGDLDLDELSEYINQSHRYDLHELFSVNDATALLTSEPLQPHAQQEQGLHRQAQV